jgi:ArsR family transcriptional regulator
LELFVSAFPRFSVSAFQRFRVSAFQRFRVSAFPVPVPDQLHPLLQRLSALNDAIRLRVLRLLDRQELSVGELARALQLPQSTVSRHLKLLHEGGWAIKRSEGTASLYRVADASLDPAARELWRIAREQLQGSPTSATFEQDDARLAGVLAERATDSRAFFGRVAGEWDHLRRDLFGERFTAEALLGLIDPEWVVADIGCGTGNAAELLAPHVRRVIAIDREPAMLDSARKRLANRDNIDFRQGDLARLPLKNNEVDAAIMVLLLHHVPEPADAITEVARCLRAGGIALLVDMVAHDRASYRHTMGHKHLGFDDKHVRAWAKAAGLKFLRYHRQRPDTDSSGPDTFVATMRK